MATFPIKDICGYKTVEFGGMMWPATEVIFASHGEEADQLDLDSILGICYGYPGGLIALYGNLDLDGMGELLTKIASDHIVMIGGVMDMHRLTEEARIAMRQALACKSFGGEFVCARDRGQGEGDIIIYLLHPNPILLGRNIAGVWRHSSAGKIIQNVDVNPDEKLPKTGLVVRRAIVDFLESEGFKLRLSNAALWPIWEREVSLLTDGSV